MDFPLRQHHIADATGLTPVHVSKVLTEFRRNGLMRIGDRTLTVLDPAGFRHTANKLTASGSRRHTAIVLWISAGCVQF
jgi:hypothetical protein